MQNIIYKIYGAFDDRRVDELRAIDGVSSVAKIADGVRLKLFADPKERREAAQLAAHDLMGVEPDYQGFEVDPE